MARCRAFALFSLLAGACFLMPRQPRVLRRVKEKEMDLLATAFKGGPPLRLTERGVEAELGSGAEGAGGWDAIRC